MKIYTADNPKFSSTLKELETTDPAHADLFNQINKDLFNNTLFLKDNEKLLEQKLKEIAQNCGGLSFSVTNEGILTVTYDDGE